MWDTDKISMKTRRFIISVAVRFSNFFFYDGARTKKIKKIKKNVKKSTARRSFIDK